VTRTRHRWSFAVGAAVLVVLLVGGRWLALETAERAWAASVPGGDAYLAARDLARLVRGLIVLVAVMWGAGNLFLVYRAIGSVQLPRRLGDLEIVEAVPRRVLLGGTLVTGVLVGAMLALGTGDWWLSAALALGPPHYGVSDPVLHRDLGYYVAQLPWADRVQGFALFATLAATALVALLYLGIGSLRIRRWRPYGSPHARMHLGALLACLALALGWGATLDPAETVAGLHGALDSGALQARLPGAAFVAAVAVAAAAASAVWTLRDRPTLLVASWGALLGAATLVYLVLPGVMRDRTGRTRLDDRLAAARDSLEGLAFGVERLEQRPPPAFPDVAAALATLPLWDADRVAAVVRRRLELGGPRGAVARAALASPSRIRSGGRAPWLVALMPGRPAVDSGRASPGWRELHRGAWARSAGPLVAVETDSGLDLQSKVTDDSTAWFGPGFAEFAVASPDTWPATRASGIPLTGWSRRIALAWSLQSPELARAETDGLLLLWRRDVRERLERLAPFAAFDAPTPVVAGNLLYWVAFGYLAAETFPLVRRMEWDGRPVRYLRAGLVGIVSAGSGDTRLYLAPGADSLATAWARWLKPLIRPLDSLPAALRAALPYPSEAFRLQAALLARANDDSAWTPRPREPFQLVGPGADASGEARVWVGQGFETGTTPQFAGLLAATMVAGRPRLVLWRPAPPVRLPGVLVGSTETAPGVLRLWNVAGQLFSEQAQFYQPAADGAGGSGGTGGSGGGGGGRTARGETLRLKDVYLTWGSDRAADGATPAAALRALLAVSPHAAPADTSLAARWEDARRLAAQAEAALAAGDLEAFGRYYAQLKALLGVGKKPLAPSPDRR